VPLRAGEGSAPHSLCASQCVVLNDSGSSIDAKRACIELLATACETCAGPVAKRAVHRMIDCLGEAFESELRSLAEVSTFSSSVRAVSTSLHRSVLALALHASSFDLGGREALELFSGNLSVCVDALLSLLRWPAASTRLRVTGGACLHSLSFAVTHFEAEEAEVSSRKRTERPLLSSEGSIQHLGSRLESRVAELVDELLKTPRGTLHVLTLVTSPVVAQGEDAVSRFAAADGVSVEVHSMCRDTLGLFLDILRLGNAHSTNRILAALSSKDGLELVKQVCLPYVGLCLSVLESRPEGDDAALRGITLAMNYLAAASYRGTSIRQAVAGSSVCARTAALVERALSRALIEGFCRVVVNCDLLAMEEDTVPDYDEREEEGLGVPEPRRTASASAASFVSPSTSPAKPKGSDASWSPRKGLATLRSCVVRLSRSEWEHLQAAMLTPDPREPVFRGCQSFERLAFAYNETQKAIVAVEMQQSPDSAAEGEVFVQHARSLVPTKYAATLPPSTLPTSAPPMITESVLAEKSIGPATDEDVAPHKPASLPQWGALPVARAPHHLAPLGERKSACAISAGLVRPSAEIVCPLSGMVMLEPVQTPSGYVCDLGSLQQWMQKHGVGSLRGPDPLSREAISLEDCEPRPDLVTKANAWFQFANKQPES
jgi:hypothetical protein